ncbi:hypothetical protein R0J89_16005, partial [Psychrobacter sp. SIMBA_152]
AAKINAAATGVVAEARLEVTIAGITNTDNATINVGDDNYDLGTYGGEMSRLAEDMVADGYDAVYDSDAGTITLKATGVDGIESVMDAGTPAGGLTF